MDNTLRKLQLCEQMILDDIDRVCAENGLQYFLVGGTLLGAVRHGGFIPWDDDLDIAMFREDYERFQAIFIEQMSEKYFLQNTRTDPLYPRVIAKVRLKGTIMQERSIEKVDMNHGVYVDIFPIDRIRNPQGLGIRVRGAIVRLCFAYKTLLAGRSNGHRMRLKHMLRFIPHILPNSWIEALLHNVCTKDNKCPDAGYVTIFLSGYTYKKQTIPAEVYGNGRKIRFEGKLYSAPEKPEAFLANLYNDYMQLPPPEKRVAHKLTKISFGPYDEYLENKVRNEHR